MNNHNIQNFLECSSEAAFATNNLGEIVGWNKAAEELFGITIDKAIGQYCDEIINGIHGNKPICTLDCAIQQTARQHCQICDFNMQVSTPVGRQWVSMSVLIVNMANEQFPYLIHIARLLSKNFSC